MGYNNFDLQDIQDSKMLSYTIPTQFLIKVRNCIIWFHYLNSEVNDMYTKGSISSVLV